jgi:hypothetical protein
MQAETDSDEVYAQIMLQPEADVSMPSYIQALSSGSWLPLLLANFIYFCNFTYFFQIVLSFVYCDDFSKSITWHFENYELIFFSILRD